MDSQDKFTAALINSMFRWCYAYQDKSWDSRRFGLPPTQSLVEIAKHKLKVVAGRRGWAARHFLLPTAGDAAANILAQADRYAEGYGRLADDYSRILYLDLLAFRVLGGEHVRLPPNTHAYWNDYRQDKKRIAIRNTGEAGNESVHWPLHLYEVRGQGGPMRLHMGPGSYYYYFILRSYDYDHNDTAIGVEPGDIVIDGGACYGETAVIFADRCAPNGRVYAFEFVPENLKIMRMNLAANPRHAERIEVVENALADANGQVFTFNSWGPGTQVNRNGRGDLQITSMTIDDLVAQKKPGRVDFIKMDIEGSELLALHGAEKTLRRFRPKLAISAYHKPEDLYTLSAYLDSLQLGYRFFMDHFTVHREETVLFAACDIRKQAEPAMAP